MVMLIDTVAERYGMLPSEVMSRANTFDVFIADTAIGYRNLVQDRAMNGGKDVLPELTTQELLDIKNGKS
jgi:hypothetical protein